MIAALALHWRAALVALVAAALCALGWHLGAAHVSAQWSAEKAATAQATSKALAAALANQQAAESKVSAIETQFNAEVSQHAKDALDYRARLASGTERVSVRVTHCSPAGESASTAASADGGAARADLAPEVASGLAEVAGADQGEIDKLRALQSYVRDMQARGYIEP
jgi:hypothetical protein